MASKKERKQVFATLDAMVLAKAINNIVPSTRTYEDDKGNMHRMYLVPVDGFTSLESPCTLFSSSPVTMNGKTFQKITETPSLSFLDAVKKMAEFEYEAEQQGWQALNRKQDPAFKAAKELNQPKYYGDILQIPGIDLYVDWETGTVREKVLGEFGAGLVDEDTVDADRQKYRIASQANNVAQIIDDLFGDAQPVAESADAFSKALIQNQRDRAITENARNVSQKIHDTYTKISAEVADLTGVTGDELQKSIDDFDFPAFCQNMQKVYDEQLVVAVQQLNKLQEKNPDFGKLNDLKTQLLLTKLYGDMTTAMAISIMISENRLEGGVIGWGVAEDLNGVPLDIDSAPAYLGELHKQIRSTAEKIAATRAAADENAPSPEGLDALSEKLINYVTSGAVPTENGQLTQIIESTVEVMKNYDSELKWVKRWTQRRQPQPRRGVTPA